jgi:glutamate mutase epsilon subunit
MYKAVALILNNAIFNDRYNDILAFQRNDIAVRIAQLDSSLNVLPNPDKINKYGLYQQEIDKINDKLKAIVKRVYTLNSGDCGCCFECAEYITTKLTIP